MSKLSALGSVHRASDVGRVQNRPELSGEFPSFGGTAAEQFGVQGRCGPPVAQLQQPRGLLVQRDPAQRRRDAGIVQR
jgi:hypothetical protein